MFSLFVSFGGICILLKTVDVIFMLRWMNKLLGEGFKKELTVEDLYEVRKEDRSRLLGDRLERCVTGCDGLELFLFIILETGCPRSRLVRREQSLNLRLSLDWRRQFSTPSVGLTSASGASPSWRSASSACTSRFSWVAARAV